MPTVSIIMSVHNGLPHLGEALDSILGQNYKDFEFIVVDDASTDGSGSFLKEIRDPRLRVITNKKQLGLSQSLNKAWDLARGKYIARMDHDDVSLPGRLVEQKRYLDNHPQVGLVGSWARTMGLAREQTWRYAETDEDLRSELIFNSPIVHSSVMLRRATFDKYKLRYDPKVARAQDYELWSRAASRITFANLQKVLLVYRVHPGQIGRRYGREQQAVAERVREKELNSLGIRPSKQEFKIHNAIARWEFTDSVQQINEIERWLEKLQSANLGTHRFSQVAFDNVLERRWWQACRVLVGLGLEAWQIYRNSPIASRVPPRVLDRSRFWIKCLLREMKWSRD